VSALLENLIDDCERTAGKHSLLLSLMGAQYGGGMRGMCAGLEMLTIATTKICM
jgi:hypothetical protein